MLRAQDLRGIYAIIPTPAKPGAERLDATDTVDLAAYAWLLGGDLFQSWRRCRYTP